MSKLSEEIYFYIKDLWSSNSNTLTISKSAEITRQLCLKYDVAYYQNLPENVKSIDTFYYHFNYKDGKDIVFRLEKYIYYKGYL
jgi:hypothetical protein